MTFVHTTTPSHSRRPLELFARWTAWPVALATACLAAWAMTVDPSPATAQQAAAIATALLIAALAESAEPQTALDCFLANAELHRWHHARGIDGTHNLVSVPMLWISHWAFTGAAGDRRS